MRKFVVQNFKRLLKIDKIRNSNDHILCFHRIIATIEEKTEHLGNYEYLLSDLELLIIYYLENGYKFVELNDIYRRKKRDSCSNWVCLTFDDGYKDFLYLVLPLLQKYDIPATVYVVPGYLNRSSPKWDYALNYVVSDMKILNNWLDTSPLLKRRVGDIHMKSQSSIYQILKNVLKDLNNDYCFNLIDKFSKICPTQVEKASNLMLNEEELLLLSKSRLITIGSHSNSHFVLTDVSDSKLIEEINNSRKYIENLLAKKLEHFCYPYGAAARREFLAIKVSEFKTATTTIGRNLRKYSLDDAVCLPRYVVRINDTVEDIDCWLKYRSSY